MLVTTALSKSVAYQAGKAAAYIDHCGHYNLNLALHKKYGKFEDYRNGEIENDLSGYDSVSGIDCQPVKKFVDLLLKRTTAVASSSSRSTSTVASIPSSTSDLHLIATQTICKVSLKKDGVEWDLSTSYFSERVKEAQSRGLSE